MANTAPTGVVPAATTTPATTTEITNPAAVLAGAPATAGPAAAPAAPVPAVGATAAVPAAAAPAATDPQTDPDWLNKRIERAKTSAGTAEQARIFKELGVTNLDEAKAKVTAAKTAEDALKTKEQRLTEENATLKTTAAEAEELRAVVAERATLEMGQLSEAQQAAIRAMPGVGDKPAAQLKAINSLRAGGFIATTPVTAQQAAASAGVPAPAAAPAARPAVAAPASTTAAAGAPAPATVTSPDRKAEYAGLLKTNPMQAAVYADLYGSEVFSK